MMGYLAFGVFGAWLAWAVAWALGLRLAIALAARRYLRLNNDRAAVLAYVGIAAILFASIPLHGAMLGPPNLYGATPREAFSLEAYLIAPFGLPLMVGGFTVILSEAVLDFLRRGARS